VRRLLGLLALLLLAQAARLVGAGGGLDQRVVVVLLFEVILPPAERVDGLLRPARERLDDVAAHLLLEAPHLEG